VESYQKDVASNPRVEMIHLSRDQDEKAALAWAKKDKLPWPHIMQKDTKDALMTHYTRAVPCYVLIDREGNKLAAGSGGAGKSAVWSKLKELK
tara:strand:- start:32 stop:310 length:279 start_codon:yes stop_codon:yes gene_type:complete